MTRQRAGSLASRCGQGQGRASMSAAAMSAPPKDPGMPPSKQQQHEEALAPLDDQERRAVQKRLQRRANHGQGASHTSRAGNGSQRYQDPAFMGSARAGRSARGRYTSRSAMSTSRSMMTTARSSSPTGRYHPDPTRRLELRKVRAPAARAPAGGRRSSRRSRPSPPLGPWRPAWRCGFVAAGTRRSCLRGASGGAPAPAVGSAGSRAVPSAAPQPRRPTRSRSPPPDILNALPTCQLSPSARLWPCAPPTARRLVRPCCAGGHACQH